MGAGSVAGRAGGIPVDVGQEEIIDLVAGLVTEADVGLVREVNRRVEPTGTLFADSAVFPIASALATIAARSSSSFRS